MDAQLFPEEQLPGDTAYLHLSTDQAHQHITVDQPNQHITADQTYQHITADQAYNRLPTEQTYIGDLPTAQVLIKCWFEISKLTQKYIFFFLLKEYFTFIL